MSGYRFIVEHVRLGKLTNASVAFVDMWRYIKPRMDPRNMIDIHVVVESL